nr:tape measure protein [uncultured Shinella sp.]
MATTDTEKLAVLLEARVTDFERKIANATRNADRNFKRISQSADTMRNRVTASASAVSKQLLGLFAGVASARAAAQLMDSATRIQNALKIAGLEGRELTDTYEALFQSAQRNAAPLEALVTLYGRMASAQKELNASQAELREFTDIVGLSIKASGQSAEEASGALLQLAQAMGGGKVQAEEYNSLLDGARPLLQAVANGMVEAGGSVSKLTALVKDGQVSSEAFFRAGIAGADSLRTSVASSEQTISARFVVLQNVLIDAAGKFDKAAGASRSFGGAIQSLTKIIASINWSNAVQQADAVANGIRNAMAAINGAGAEFGRSTGMDQFGVWLSDITGFDLATPEARGAKTYWDKYADAQIKARNDALARIANDPTEYGPQLPKPFQGPMPLGEQFGPVWEKPKQKVSLKDYAVPSGTSGGSGSRGGGGGGSESDYAREIKQMQERTTALQNMTVAQQAMNPLVEDYGFAIEKATAKQELMTAATRDGKEVTADMARDIDAAADAYARAAAAAEKQREAQEQARETADFFGQAATDAFSELIPAIETGNKALDRFLNTLVEAAAEALLLGKGPLASLLGGGGGIFGGGGGLFGGAIIPGILHSGGTAGNDGYGHGRAFKPSTFAGAKRYHSGGIAGLQPGEIPAILQRGEVVLPRGTKMGGKSSAETINIALQADPTVIASIADQRIETRQGTIVNVAVSRANKSAPAAVGRYQAMKAGGDYRND